MGKCLSCLRIDSVPHNSQAHACGCPRTCFHLKNINCKRSSSHCTGIQNSDNNPGNSEIINFKARHVQENPFGISCTTNSNTSTQTTVSSMPEKRSFYSRIPPLSRSIGHHDGRRALSKECSDAKIRVLYQHYKDPNMDAILADGIVRFCSDLDVKPDDYKVLLFAWKCRSETMCKFTKEEFFNGCRALKSDSIKGIQSKFNDLLTEAQNPETFKDIYRFTFNFGLDSENGERILPIDMAILLWKLVFSQREPPILTRFINYLEQHPNVRGISKDTWYMFLNFTETISDDLSVYDDTEAWPSLLDDFVEYENDKLNQNISKDDKEIV